MNLQTIALSLGSNMGDRLQSLRLAIKNLESLGIYPQEKSDVFETPPWGNTQQPLFLNACVLARTRLSGLDLLTCIKQAEKMGGRVPRERWHKREIDIDALLYQDGSIRRDPFLTIPHPLIQDRAFVLLPLSQIAGDWLHPLYKQTVNHLKLAIDCTNIKRITAL